MVRSTLHQAVYGLASGGGVLRRHPHSTPLLPSESNAIKGLKCPLEAADGTAAARMEEKVELPEMKLVHLRTPKRNQVAPTQEGLSAKTSSVANRSKTKWVDAGSRVRDEAVAKAMQSSSSTLLSKIRHGLYAGRIIPADATEISAEVKAPDAEQLTTSNVMKSAAPPLAIKKGKRRRVYPEEALQRNKISRGDDGDGESITLALPSSLIPARTNMDAKKSPSHSESHYVPPSVSVAPNSSYHITQPTVGFCPDHSCAGNCASIGARLPQFNGNCNGVQKQVGADLPRQLPGDSGRGCTRRGMSFVETDPMARMASKSSLGSRHVEELRDRLNRTLSPQGVEVNSVMIGFVELPPDIATKMSEKTLNVSLAEEQRAAKVAESQKVRHAGEVQGLHQRHRIEMSLAARKGDNELEKVINERVVQRNRNKSIRDGWTNRRRTDVRDRFLRLIYGNPSYSRLGCAVSSSAFVNYHHNPLRKPSPYRE